MNLVRKVVSADEITAGVKFHKIAHWPLYISLFGSSSNYSTETFESQHKWSVKKWTRSVSYKAANIEKKLMRKDIVGDIHISSPLTSSTTRSFRGKRKDRSDFHLLIESFFKVSLRSQDIAKYNSYFLSADCSYVKVGYNLLYSEPDPAKMLIEGSQQSIAQVRELIEVFGQHLFVLQRYTLSKETLPKSKLEINYIQVNLSSECFIANETSEYRVFNSVLLQPNVCRPGFFFVQNDVIRV